jgi:hypothetical protein
MDGDFVKARLRRSSGDRYLFGPLRIGKKGGFSVNNVSVRQGGLQVLEGNEKRLLKIFLKTEGHCHFCGDELDFEKRGWDANLTGRWEVDHVIQRKKRGASTAANYLPACTRCNRLRWSRTGTSLRAVIFLGLVARDEAYFNPQSRIGQKLRQLRIQRLAENWRRRMRKSLTPQEYKRKVAVLPKLIDNMERFEARALKRYAQTLKKRRRGRIEITSTELNLTKPPRSHVSWTGIVEAVRNDRRTPRQEKSAEQTLRE